MDAVPGSSNDQTLHREESGAYYSCNYLEGHLGIDHKTYTVCCVLHSDGKKGCIRLGAIEGNKVPVEKILSVREELIQANQTDEDTPCKGCPMLEKKVWPERKYLINTINVDDWIACNLKCDYCYLTADGFDPRNFKGSHDTLKLFEDIFENDYLNPDGQVAWAGGDVTVNKKFPPISRELVRRGVHQQINTNAVLYSDAIDEALKANAAHVIVSVDAGTRETYELVKGKDAYDDVWKNMARYASSGKVMAKYIVKEENNSDENILNFVQKCNESKVANVIITPENAYEVPEANGKFVSEKTLRAAALMISECNRFGLPTIEQFYIYNPRYSKSIEKHLRNIEDVHSLEAVQAI